MDPNESLAKAEEAAGWLSSNATMLLAAMAAVIGLYIVWKILSTRKKPVKQVPDLTIDVMSLGADGPQAGAVELQLRNVPVRLAAIVVAPAGRVRELPPLNRLSDIFDAIIPGLAGVVSSHKTLIRRWPAQLSTRGFAHTFFQHVRLPGEGGKGTPWSSAAGVCKIEGQPVMAGLLFRTEGPSSHGQDIVEDNAQWLSLLQIK